MAATEATAKPPGPEIASQDPLPESNWFFRRWLAIGTSVFVGVLHLLILTGIWLMSLASPAAALASINAFLVFGCWLVCFNTMSYLLYLVAPSAEQAGKWMASIALLRGGGLITTHSKAETPEGKVEATTTTTGGSPAEPVPATPLTPAPVPALEPGKKGTVAPE